MAEALLDLAPGWEWGMDLAVGADFEKESWADGTKG